MTDELRPCPFCGSTELVEGQDVAQVLCYHCVCQGWRKDWNKRPIEDALRAEVERLKVAEGEAMLVVESQDVSIANLRAEVAVLREQRDHKFEQFLDWRGIEVGEQCDRCQGAGSYMYSSTATWMGGIGGQAMTVGVCDKCWGSGKKNSPWTNLRDVMQIRREIAALKARLAKFEGPLTDEQMRLARERWKAMENDGTDYGNVRNWDAAIRAAREGER